VRGVDVSGYVGLFGEPGLALSEAQWVEHANQHLTPNLSALNTRYLDGSREERWLRMSYEPGPGAFNFAQLSGGSIAEMLDQAATHCGSLVTGYPCPTLSMTVTILRGGTAKSYVATGRVLKLTRVTAVLGADLDDDAGRRIATVTVVSQLITDLSRLA
jgi:acyl-coenzyme A thioesterase PaaI-like protein